MVTRNSDATDKPLKSRERFVELAEKRVTRAIKDLNLIGNLSNKSNYSYSEEDVDIIIKTLQKELNRTKERFHSNIYNGNKIFKL